MREVFGSEFGQTPETIRIDGLLFDDYGALLFGIFTVARTGGRDRLTSIVDVREHVKLLDLAEEDVLNFLVARSYTAEQFRAHGNVISGRDEFVARMLTHMKGKKKGVRQLAEACLAARSGSVKDVPTVKHIFPVLVVEDPSLQTVGMNSYLHEKFAPIKWCGGEHRTTHGVYDR